MAYGGQDAYSKGEYTYSQPSQHHPPQHQQGYGAPPPQQQYSQQYSQPPPQQPSHGGSPWPPPPQPPPPAPHNDYAQHGPPDLRKCFDDADDRRENRLADRELVLALRYAGVDFSIESCRMLIQMYDQKGDKKLSFEEFQLLHQYIDRHRQQFNKLGTDHNGMLSPQTVHMAIAQSGYTISQECFSTLMKKFDRRKQHALGLDGYIELSVFIHNVKDTFAFYDKQRTGQVMFNFDAFTMASVHLHSV